MCKVTALGLIGTAAVVIGGIEPADAQIAEQTVASDTPESPAGHALQTSGQDAADTGEIIVTARKRSERLRDVAVSVTAATGDKLAELNVTSPAGLEKITPGFTALVSGYGTPVYTIRGIGYIDTSVVGAPAVSVYVDQVPLPFSLMAAGATLDLERVEVLKGPQGTLFGQNSTGGAINYVAAKPTRSVAAGGEITYGRFDRFDVNAFVSGPLSDTLGVRVAVRSEQRGDWQKSYTRDDTLGQRDFLAGRILLEWQPSDRLHFAFNANGWRDKSDTVAAGFIGYQPTSPAGYADAMAALRNYPIAPDDPRAADWDAGRSFQRDDSFYQFALSGDWEVSDELTLYSITSYMRYEPFVPIDQDGSTVTNLTSTITGEVKTWVQELRLAGDMGAFKWMIGGNYQHDYARERHILALNPTTNNGVGPFRYTTAFLDGDQTIETAAIFGSMDYEFTPALTAQVSARYTDQSRAFDGCLRDAGDGRLAAAFGFLATNLSRSPVVIPAGGCVTLADATPTPLPIVSRTLDEDNVSWRVGLNWKPEPDTLIYANVSQGYKAGNFPISPAIRAAQYTPAVQEGVLAYEAGIKTDVADNLLLIDASAFYYEYSDKQIRGFVDTGPPFGNLPRLVNVPKSTVLGAELNLTLRPAEGLVATAGGSLVRSRITGPYLVNDQASNIVDAGGQAFPSAPKWQLNGDVQYDLPTSDGWVPFVGGHVTYRTGTSAFLGGNPIFAIPGYTLLDLRAGVRSRDDSWRIQVFGDNVTNEFYINNVIRPIDAFARVAGMPATWGIRIGYSFQ